MNPQFNLIYVIRIILKWKWAIAAAVVISGIAAVLVSLFVLPEEYKSGAIFYPVNQGITDRSVLFSQGGGEVRVDYFGTKNDANRVLELATSAPLVDFMINHYNLMQHYGIDSTDQYARFKTQEKFRKRFEVIKTERDAIAVTIYDEDPQMASDMVNLLLQKIDEHNKRPVIKNKQRIASTFQVKVTEKEAELDTATIKLAQLGERNNIKLTVDSEGNSVITGPTAAGVELYKIAQQKHQRLLDEANELNTLYEQFELASRENVPSLYIVEQAYPADRRTKPVRSLVCITTVLITFFLSIIAVLLLEQINYIREELAKA